MKHLVLLPTLLISAICATAAFALDKTHVSRKSPQAPVQQSAVAEGADNFYKSDQVTTQRVTFKNQYNMQVAGNLFIPKALDQNAKHPAIIVGHPMGAVKEQSANLYAQKLADQGFVSICPSGARVRGDPATLFRRIFMPRISVLRSIFWAPGHSLTGAGLAFLGFAAAGASSSAPPRSTRA